MSEEISEERKSELQTWALGEIKLGAFEATAVPYLRLDEIKKEIQELQAQKARWYNMTQQLLNVKEELIAEIKLLKTMLQGVKK